MHGKYIPVILLTLCAAVQPAGAADSVRVAVVDMEKLLSEHPNTASDKALLQETLQDYEQEGESAREKVEELQQAAEQAEQKSRSAALSERARTEALQEAGAARERWEQARAEWREKMRELQQLLSEQEMRMIRRTVTSLDTMIDEFARENGYDLVLDASGKRMGNLPMILYHRDGLDITEALIRRLHSGAGKPPKEAAGETGDASVDEDG